MLVRISLFFALLQCGHGHMMPYGGMWNNNNQPQYRHQQHQQQHQQWPGQFQQLGNAAGPAFGQQFGNFQTERSWPCYPRQYNSYYNKEFYTESDRCNGDYRCSNGRDERTCPGKCLGPQYSEKSYEVDCKESHMRWQYWPLLGQCRFFVYGGCAVQQNLFLTRLECELECLAPTRPDTDDRRMAPQPPEFEQVGDDDDDGELDFGLFEDAGADELPADLFEDLAEEEVILGKYPCDSNATDAHGRQYYNDTDRCNGIYVCENGVDELNCSSKCYGFRYSDDTQLLDCRASIPRYFYNIENQTCTFFHYGGCANVINMFRTEKECLSECRGIVKKEATSPADSESENMEETPASDNDAPEPEAGAESPELPV